MGRGFNEDSRETSRAVIGRRRKILASETPPLPAISVCSALTVRVIQGWVSEPNSALPAGDRGSRARPFPESRSMEMSHTAAPRAGSRWGQLSRNRRIATQQRANAKTTRRIAPPGLETPSLVSAADRDVTSAPSSRRSSSRRQRPELRLGSRPVLASAWLQGVGQPGRAHESGDRGRALGENAGVRGRRLQRPAGGRSAADFFDQFSNNPWSPLPMKSSSLSHPFLRI